MKISQILNNNVALVQRGTNEVIVLSRGIAFRKRVGDKIDKSDIEKIFVPDSKDMLEHFSYLLENTKEEYILIINKIIEYGAKELECSVNDYIYLTLLDHMDFAIKRAVKNQFIKSPLSWDVKKFYPKYFKIGLEALKIIHKDLGIDFPDDEAVSIALHFINLQTNKLDMNDTIKNMGGVTDLLSIINYHFNMQLDTESVNYMRLVTHIQYFIQRLNQGQIYESDDIELNKQIKNLYPGAFECVTKIRNYILKQYERAISTDEETYLILHVQRVSQRK